MKTIEYTFSRLCFKADVIESLDDNDVFIVHTPDGSFRMTYIEYFQMYPKQKVIKKEEFITANIHQSEQCSF